MRKMPLNGRRPVLKTGPTAGLRVRFLHSPPDLDAGTSTGRQSGSYPDAKRQSRFDSDPCNQSWEVPIRTGWCRRCAVNAVPLWQEVRFHPLPTKLADLVYWLGLGVPLRRGRFDSGRPHQESRTRNARVADEVIAARRKREGVRSIRTPGTNSSNQ